MDNKVFWSKNTVDRKKDIYEYLWLGTPNTIPVEIKSDLSLLWFPKGSFVVVDRSNINPIDGQIIFCTTDMTTYPIIRLYSKDKTQIILDDWENKIKPKECTIYWIVISTFTRI